jgi:hypothetical protein
MVDDFDITNPYGLEGEELVRRYGEMMQAGEAFCEVKRKTHRDWKLYVEREQKTAHGEGPVKPSGIMATDAPLFAYVLADTGIVIVFPTNLLRDASRRPIGTAASQLKQHQGNPTKGRLLGLDQILDRYEPDSSGWPVPAGGWKELSEL